MPSPGHPQSLNRYGYTLGNPLKYVDPTGHIPASVPPRPVGLWSTLNVNVSDWSPLARGLLQYGACTLVPCTIGSDGQVHDDVLAQAIASVPGPAIVTSGSGQFIKTGAKAAETATEGLAQSLVKVGVDSTEGSQLVKGLAEASTRNGRVQGGFTMLGSFPEYTNMAKLEGVTFFDMPKKVWETLSQAGDDFVWAVNKQFLDDSIVAKNSFVVTLGENKSIGKYLQREIKYLIDNGYKLVNGVFVRPE